MQFAKSMLPVTIIVGAALSMPAQANHDRDDDGHAVFVMTNDAQANEIPALQRNPYGTLFLPRHFKTEGRGSGGKADPLASQGSLTLSQDREWLFAVNADSGTYRCSGSKGSVCSSQTVLPQEAQSQPRSRNTAASCTS